MKKSSSPLLKAALVGSLLTLSACADLSTARSAYQVQDYEVARKNLEELAKRGFPQAMTKLGEMYTSGNGAPVNYAKALSLFRQAEAKEKYPPAIVDMGEAYRLGLGVPKDPAKAREHYQRALALGYTGAYVQLGLLEQDARRYAAAENYFNKAVSSGNTAGWKYLGDMRVQQGKFAEAEDDYRKGIAAGDISGYVNLGHLHMDQKKFAEAEKDFENSVSKGNSDALLSLGDAQIALGKFKDAEETYKTALKGGNMQAEVKIGNMYRLGSGRPIDGAMALYWYYKARKDGVAGMDERIMHAERKLQPEELARALKLSSGKTK
jgi:TPR repeat protein